MKLVVCGRCQYVCYIGLCTLITLFLASCRFGEPGVKRIMQSDITCQTVIRVKWGNGAGELGYIPDGNPSYAPRKPFRYQIDNTGNIFIADLHNERVLKFTPEGMFLKSFNVPMTRNNEYMVDIAARKDWIAVATTDYVYVFDQDGNPLRVLEWPTDAGQYSLCSEDVAGRKVQIDDAGNIYVCGAGGFERGGTIVQFDSKGHSREFFEGGFWHFVVGWDNLVYIQQSSGLGAVDSPPDNRILKFDSQNSQVGEVVIRGYDLADTGLTYPGTLVAADASGNLYGSAVNMLANGDLVSKEMLVQISPEGSILRILEHDKFQRPAIDVIDGEGNLYLWHFADVPSSPAEIWRCSP